MATTLLLLSDLHLETGPFAPDPAGYADVDVVLLAGDIDYGARAVRWARAQFGDRELVYVLGNHCRWNHTVRVLDEMRTVGRELGVHVLERETVMVAGIRVAGCTLWTDYRLHVPPDADEPTATALALAAMREATDPHRGHRDFRRIRMVAPYRRLSPADTVTWHRESVRWLREAVIARPVREPTVIVTHHAPSARGLAPGGETARLAPVDASHLDALVAESGAALWVHGHTHHAHDTRIGATRLVSNPRGYADAPVPGFAPGLRLVVPEAQPRAEADAVP